MAPTDRSIGSPLMAGTVEEPPGAIERLVLDQLPVAVAATDVQGIVTHWSRHSESLFGWTAEEAVGRNLLDLLVDAPDREAADAMLASARVGEPSHGELRVRRRYGSRLVCRLSQSPLHGNGGTLAGIAWAWMDITRDKESDRRLVARTTVTRVLAEAMSVEEAVPNVLQAVCQSLGWEVGVLWRVDQAANRLYCADLWR